jgi:ABC-type antimicrobial peptide transport system permease subunit
MVPAVRSAVGELDPDLAVSAPRTMDAILSRSIAQPRFYALVVALFSALALVLCALGVYGVIAFGVRRRSREIGIRMAVGAGGARILRLVLREALLMGAVGVALGLGLALAVSRLLSGLLYHVRPVDPAVYALVATAVLAIAVLAAVLPARRATRVDPMSILRTE